MSDNQDMSMLQVNGIDEDLKHRFRMIALSKKTSMAELVRQWIKEYVEKHEQSQEKAVRR